MGILMLFYPQATYLSRNKKQQPSLPVDSIDVYTYFAILIIKGPKSIHFYIIGYIFQLLFLNYLVNYLKHIGTATGCDKDIGSLDLHRLSQ